MKDQQFNAKSKADEVLAGKHLARGAQYPYRTLILEILTISLLILSVAREKDR
jgi:hypothetical protein